jgi:ATP-dependent DNA helicase PIF1
MKIEINEQFKQALEQLEQTRKSIFITGNAGTGKSTLLTHFRFSTKKKTVVLAPTGVSALNVKGQTIHSFFGFAPDIRPEKVHREKASDTLIKILKHLDVIVIDEVSMVRADMMDCMDIALRHHLETSEPFGGIQMVFIGDLHQLPPVVVGDEERQRFKSEYNSPYFFDAKVFENTEFERIELKKIYRQQAGPFVNLLNKIRLNKAGYGDLSALNERVLPDPMAFHATDHSHITLTTTNKMANDINSIRLKRLTGWAQVYDAEVEGSFEGRSQPTLKELELKAGAQIMMLNNDIEGRWVNGSIGKVEKIAFDAMAGEDVLHVKLEGASNCVIVEPHTWELNKYNYDEESGEIGAENVGSFRQYPLRLAWAITIHKSQGKTFDKVVVDIGKGAFAHGQVYVALSRCSSLDGLLLQSPIQRRHIWSNRRVEAFESGQLRRRREEMDWG